MIKEIKKYTVNGGFTTTDYKEALFAERVYTVVNAMKGNEVLDLLESILSTTPRAYLEVQRYTIEEAKNEIVYTVVKRYYKLRIIYDLLDKIGERDEDN